ncbi:MAG: type II toxin-antitoxin system VapC family toxin [Prevotella sp.]|nr:type II toxin-antitoxin system VapC family toxin [Prevotella sp.]
MRLYLDTNIVIFMLNKDEKSIDDDTQKMLLDDGNVLFTSAICVQEIVHLTQTGNLFADKKKKKRQYKSQPFDIIDRVKALGIEIVPINELHLRKLQTLPIVHDHRDPFDRLIIAQAIADKATLVSTDRMFPNYVELGLKLHQNFN